MEFFSALHPVAVHFPVALIIFYSLFEIAALFINRKEYYFFSLIMLFSGITGAVFAVITGNQSKQLIEAANLLNDNSLITAVENHEQAANYFLWYLIFLVIIRIYLQNSKKIYLKIRYILIVFIIVGIYLTYEAGRLGGILVYQFGAGTDPFFNK